MPFVRLPIGVCVAVAGILKGSHNTLDAAFEAAGAPGPPPNLSHESKWKVWLQRAGKDPSVDTLGMVGDLIGEFMDCPPDNDDGGEYVRKREKLVNVLEENGLRYFRGGRVLPNGVSPETSLISTLAPVSVEPKRPSSVEELLQCVIRGLPRAMHPLTHRRKGLASLSMETEYDIQDLLHSQLRPWISDIRPEEFTPSYAGSNTRMDFLLPAHSLVVEVKRIRDKLHASKVGDELIIDIEHYRRHPKCNRLWCVVFDPQHVIPNPTGLVTDLEGARSTPDGSVEVRVFVFSAPT